MKGSKRFKTKPCPFCRALTPPTITDNTKEYRHPADTEAAAKGFPFMPHWDIDYNCPHCGLPFEHHTVIQEDWEPDETFKLALEEYERKIAVASDK